MDKKICGGRRNFATATSQTSSKPVNHCSNGSKRDALAELTNSLIPTEVLLDLCSNPISTSKAQDLLRRSHASTLPVSKNLQNSKSDSKSDTSIGSSNYNNILDSQNPSPFRPHLSSSSCASLGNEGRKFTVYSRSKTSENLEGPRKIDSDLASSAPVKNKTKDVGKVIPAHLNTTSSYKAKYSQTADAVLLDSIHSEKVKAKKKEIAVPLSSTSVEKVKDKGNAIVGSRSCTPVEKPKDKGKSIAVPLSSTSAEKGKAVAIPPISLLNDQAEAKEKSTGMLINQPLKKKLKRNVRANVSSCPPLWRTRSIRDKLIEADDVKPSKAWSDPHPKKKKTRHSTKQTVSDYSLSQEFEKQKAYFQEIDAFELPVEEVSDSDLD